MHFPGLMPSSAKADTFGINCSPTPAPTPITDGTPTPAPTYVTPTPYPTATPLEILPNQFQNPNNASMAWIQFGGDTNHRKPGVLVIHGTWHAGSAEDVLGQVRDIAKAGFFAAGVFFELAPNPNPVEGYIPGQPSHELDGQDPGWRMTLEVNDIKNYVKAMRADSRCNGWVGVVGGSAGGVMRLRLPSIRILPETTVMIGRTGFRMAMMIAPIAPSCFRRLTILQTGRRPQAKRRSIRTSCTMG
jgi:hypothetical protein